MNNIKDIRRTQNLKNNEFTSKSFKMKTKILNFKMTSKIKTRNFNISKNNEINDLLL